jgi:SAM-dependent methyltransferase
MNSAEYDNLERIEGSHWYYAGKRQLVQYWLDRIGPPTQRDVLLDCGAGTGRFAKEMLTFCQVLVLDDHEEALSLLRQRFRAEQVLSLKDGGVPLPNESLNFITALDVLEHVPDDPAVVRGFHALLKDGGVVVVTVPAGMALWSDWDVSLHHHRRYSRRQLKFLFPPADWDIVHLNYTNVLAYPAVWLLRKWRRWFPARAGMVRSEDKVPGATINRMLQWSFVELAKWRIPFPFGVSLVLVARKR